MMGAISEQPLARGGIPRDLRQEFLDRRKQISGRGLRLVDLVGMSGFVISVLPQVFTGIDALSKRLSRNLAEPFTTRIFLTRRPRVKEAIQRHPTKAL